MAVDPRNSRNAKENQDWGATRTRMVGRFDKVVNWARRGRQQRESHAHHHQKTKRMER